MTPEYNQKKEDLLKLGKKRGYVTLNELDHILE